MAVSLSSSDVVSQIASKLLDVFSERIPTVYKDTPLQGMTKPCFFIQQLNTVHIKEMNTRGERQYFMDIRAHPSDDEDSKFTWCNTIGHELFEVLETIEISQQNVRAFSMRFEIKDEVLHFFVQYSFKVKKQVSPGVKMQTLETDETINYGKGR